MIPFTSCMCPVRMPVQRRGRWLVVSQKDTETETGKDEEASFIFRSNDGKDANQNSASYFYRAWHISRRRSRRAVITPVDSINFLDDTYFGTAQVLLSKCNRWSFSTFNLDVSTGGRSLPILLFHLFNEYGFINYFCLDVIKVWRCFNLMDAVYHRHNPYHNSVHAADVTQAMHCFLKENKFSDYLTPLEAMSSIIAAVAHDLDHPGVTQTFLVATSNHLVDLYNNSSVLENHHWKTAVSCLLESGIFSHLEKETWLDIQKQIRSLILATDITRQKEFLGRFKGYLSSQSLDMEKSHYRHFALQIALKCADLCNPCRPWAISQRWSYQVCQEFYRQGSFEHQLNLPLTPTFDCSKSKIPKIQTDFFQHVVMPLFETWDSFLGTHLSNLLLKNLHYNYIQWQQKMDVMDVQQTKIKDSNIKSLRLLKEDCNKNKLERNPVPQHVRIIFKDNKLPTQKQKVPQLLSPRCHLQTYYAEELHPLTSLLSLSSTMSTVLLRKACIISETESHLISMNVMHPFTAPSSDGQVFQNDFICAENAVITSPLCKTDKKFCTFSKADINYKAQITSVISDSNDCCTRLSLKELKSEESEPRHCQPGSFLSTLTELKQQKYQLLDCNKDIENYQQNCAKPLLTALHKSFDGKNIKISTSNASCPTFYHTNFQNTFTGKANATKTSLCSTKNVQKIIAPVKFTASWCWHIRRSLSAERPQQSCHDFDLFSTRKGSNSCQTCNKCTGRRGSAPVPSVWNRDNSQTLSAGNTMDDKKRLVGETEACGPTVRRWSIPLEPISS